MMNGSLEIRRFEEGFFCKAGGFLIIVQGIMQFLGLSLSIKKTCYRCITLANEISTREKMICYPNQPIG